MDIQVEMVKLFKALSHKKRVEIVEILKDGPLCVCDILPKLDIEQSNASQHLSILRQAGILTSYRSGTKVIYKLTQKEVLDLLKTSQTLIIKKLEADLASLKL